MEQKAEGNPPSPEPARHGGMIYALPPPALELDEGKVASVPTVPAEEFTDVHPYDLGMGKITRPTPQEVAELNAVFKMKMYSRPKRRRTYRDAKCGDSEPARKVEDEKATAEEKSEEEDKDESEEEEEEDKDEIEEDKDESEEDEDEDDKSSEMDAEEMIAELESSEKSLRGGLFNEEQAAWAKLMKGSAAWRKKLTVMLRKWLTRQEAEKRDGVAAGESAAFQKLRNQITAAMKQAHKKDEKRQAESRKADEKREIEAKKAVREALVQEETGGRASVTELESKAAAKIAKQLVAAEKKLQKQNDAAKRKRQTAATAAIEAVETEEMSQRRVVEDGAVSARHSMVVSFRATLLKVASTGMERVHAKGKKEVETMEAAARVKLQKQITASMKQARKADEKRQAEKMKAEEKRAAEAMKAAREMLAKEEAGGRASVAEVEGKAAAKIAKQLATAGKKLQKKSNEKEASRREALMGKETTARCEVATEEQKESRAVAINFTVGAERKLRREFVLDEAACREELAEHAPAAARLSQLAELLDLITADVDLQERCEEVFKYEEPPPAPLQSVGPASRNRLSVGIDSPERQPRSSVLEPPQRRHRPSSARTRPGEPLDHAVAAKRSRLSTARPDRTAGETGMGALSNKPPRRSEGQYRAPPPSPLSEVKAKARGRLPASTTGRGAMDGEPRLSTASAVSRRLSRSAPPAATSELRAVTRISRQRLQATPLSEGEESAGAPAGSQGAPVEPTRDSRRSVPRKVEPRLSAVSWQQRRRLQAASTLSDDDRGLSEPRNSAPPVRRGSTSRRDSVGRVSVGRSSRGPSQRAKELDAVVPSLRPRLRHEEGAKQTTTQDEDVEMPTQGSLFTPAAPRASCPSENDASTAGPGSPREDMAEPKLGEFLSLPEEPALEEEEEEKPLQGALVGQAPPPKRRRSLYKQPEAPVAKEQRRPSVNLPRGARSAFHFFCDARMPSLMKQNRDRSYSQLRQWLRDSWDLLPECERAEFEHKQACSVASTLQKPAPPTPEILSQARPSVEVKQPEQPLSPFSKLMAEERRKAEQTDRVPEPSARQPRHSILRRSEGRSQARQEEEKKEEKGRRSRSRVRWAEDVHVHRNRDSGGSYDEPMTKE